MLKLLPDQVNCIEQLFLLDECNDIFSEVCGYYFVNLLVLLFYNETKLVPIIALWLAVKYLKQLLRVDQSIHLTENSPDFLYIVRREF